ncbi:MAG: phosphoribosylaminoimidazolesuccinocarboxamide synthase [Candidatus Dadabacteria bacterium]|nr:phosphoribosylaminoimidazolesuccinocarboxamide synthase [Candidatus Dadabacteria bacterium]NIQ12939.1 phosphoribosylaminoimidazolesuccinocarboxamide synthase [Candidatus Dadabacteria bacterium]
MILSTDFIKHAKPLKGKVREIYYLEDKLLIVTTDRISAFDVILPCGIPDKGIILNKISEFWFEKTKGIIKNHLISTDIKDFPAEFQNYKKELSGRSMLVLKTNPLPIECIVRGYISGSGWLEYKNKGSISGVDLPEGLKESEKLPEPIFTPSTKAEKGMHDENITFEQTCEIIGREISERIKKISIEIYLKAAKMAAKKGIIIADTKFEFGIDPKNNELYLIDEVLTPDSSRFWPADIYEPGKPQKSYDKQFVRDYLNSLDWNKKPPAPDIPEDIVKKTREKYLKIQEIFTD